MAWNYREPMINGQDTVIIRDNGAGVKQEIHLGGNRYTPSVATWRYNDRSNTVDREGAIKDAREYLSRPAPEPVLLPSFKELINSLWGKIAKKQEGSAINYAGLF